MYDKATRALYGVISKCRKRSLSIDCKLGMFDKVIKLNLWSTVWDITIPIKFCKQILNLKYSTPNDMVYGELGRFPLNINVKVRMISF